MAAGGDEAKRVFDAMMTMKKLDVAAVEGHGAAGYPAARSRSLFGLLY